MTTNPALPERRRQARRILSLGLAVITVEASVYVGLGVIAIASVQAGGVANAIGIGLFVGAYGLAQLYAGSKLFRWHTWARGPLVFTQLIQVGLAWGLRDSDRQWLSILMAVGAVVALVCVLAPAVTRALIDD